jgi:hypothetical protein
LDLDDENPEIWYLMGFNEESSSPPDLEAAQEQYENGKLLVESKIKNDPSLKEVMPEIGQFHYSLCL